MSVAEIGKMALVGVIYASLAVIFVIATLAIYSTRLTGYHTPSLWWGGFSAICAFLIVFVLKKALFFIGAAVLGRLD